MRLFPSLDQQLRFEAKYPSYGKVAHFIRVKYTQLVWFLLTGDTSGHMLRTIAKKGGYGKNNLK
jgi:hypothetical protein